jgi:RNA recognition motif-containing protein
MAVADETEGNTVVVRNLKFSTEAGPLSQVFSQFGEVTHVSIATDRRDRQFFSRGYGFVTFATADACQVAVSAANIVVDNRKLAVEIARGRRGGPSSRDRRGGGPPTRDRRGGGPTADRRPADGDNRPSPERDDRARRGRDDHRRPLPETRQDGQPPANPDDRHRRAAAAHRDRVVDGGRGRHKDDESLYGDTVFISGMPAEVTDADLFAVFADYRSIAGKVAQRDERGQRGYGFVGFETAEDQARAVRDKRDGGIQLGG